jgi:ketosteroid isomerase-like protein
MHPDVDWPNGMEGGREHGRETVRRYWTRQFTMIDSHVEPESLRATDDGRVAVHVNQVVRDLDGNIVSDSHVEHVYSFRDGRVAHMEIRDA